MANIFCSALTCSHMDRARTTSTRSSSTNSKRSEIKRMFRRISHRSTPATVNTSVPDDVTTTAAIASAAPSRPLAMTEVSSDTPRRPLVRPSVYSLGSLRAWNRMSAISYSEQQDHCSRSNGTDPLVSTLDLSRLHSKMRARPRPSPLSPVMRPSTDSYLFVTNRNPLSPASIFSPIGLVSPPREILEEYMTRVFESQVPPSSTISSQLHDGASVTSIRDSAHSPLGESIVSATSLSTSNERPGFPGEQAMLAQVAKPTMVRISSRTFSKHGCIEGQRHVGRSKCLDKPLPPLPPPERLSHNALPYQPYCDIFAAGSTDDRNLHVPSRDHRLASVVGFDLHLPGPRPSVSLRRKPVPGTAPRDDFGPQLSELELMHDLLPYQPYSEPLQAVRSADESFSLGGETSTIGRPAGEDTVQRKLVAEIEDLCVSPTA